MNINLDYWMFGIIDHALKEQLSKGYEGTHRNCSGKCLNRWCSTGQRNLIINKMNDIQEQLTEEVLNDLEEELK